VNKHNNVSSSCHIKTSTAHTASSFSFSSSSSSSVAAVAVTKKPPPCRRRAAAAAAAATTAVIRGGGRQTSSSSKSSKRALAAAALTAAAALGLYHYGTTKNTKPEPGGGEGGEGGDGGDGGSAEAFPKPQLETYVDSGDSRALEWRRLQQGEQNDFFAYLMHPDPEDETPFGKVFYQHNPPEDENSEFDPVIRIEPVNDVKVYKQLLSVAGKLKDTRVGHITTTPKEIWIPQSDLVITFTPDADNTIVTVLQENRNTGQRVTIHGPRSIYQGDIKQTLSLDGSSSSSSTPATLYIYIRPSLSSLTFPQDFIIYEQKNYQKNFLSIEEIQENEILFSNHVKLRVKERSL